MGLPIPKPIIVKVTAESLLDDMPNGATSLAFGSLDAGYPSFRRHLNNPSSQAVLAEFNKSFDVGVFDEWIANADRNVGNILFDGGKSFFFIDHELSIPESMSFDEAASDNQLIRCLYSLKSEFEKHKLKRDVQLNIAPLYSEIPFALLSEMTYATSYLEESVVIDIINFLNARISLLDKLMSSRLSINQMEMRV